MVKISKKSLKKEHKHLVKVLKSGTKKQRMKEAKEQKQEMKRYNIIW